MVRVKAGEILAQQGINAMVINMATVKPLDEELVLAAAKKCGKIITCEEHSVIGGLGEAVCNLLSVKLPTPVRRVGVNDEFGHSGPTGALQKNGIVQHKESKFKKSSVFVKKHQHFRENSRPLLLKFDTAIKFTKGGLQNGR